MYKGTSNSAHFAKRTASHSTKGRQNGRIDVLPPEASFNREKYQNFIEQYASLRKRREEIDKELKILKEKLKPTLPYGEFWPLRERQDFLGMQMLQVNSELGHFKKVINEAIDKEYSVVFYRVAEEVLHKEVFIQIQNEVARIKGWSKERITYKDLVEVVE